MSDLTSQELSSPVGLIAGSGQFPVEFAENAKKRGLKTVVVAVKGETDPQIEALSDNLLWIKVGQVGKAIRFLSRHGVKQAAFAGGISRVRLFGGFRPDWKAIRLIARLGSIRDDVILRGLAEEIEKTGIEVISAGVLLEKSILKGGHFTRRDFTEQEASDALYGFEVARATGALDIGQTVVVQGGLVVAVEAVEGTDAAIIRGGHLTASSRASRKDPAINGPVVIKLCKPQQDLRLDLPTVGEKTIHSMVSAGATALLLEAGKTLMLNPEEVIRLANEHNIAIRAVSGKEELK